MKLISNSVLIINLLFVPFLYCQEKKPEKYGLKLNLNSHFEIGNNYQINNTANFSNTTYSLRSQLFFSPSFTILKTNGNFFEFEISELKITKETDQTIYNRNLTGLPDLVTGKGQTTKTSNIALRSSYNFSILRPEVRGIYFNTGLATNIYYHKYHLIPTIPTIFDIYDRNIGINLELINRIGYKFNRHFAVEFSVPLQLVGMEHNRLTNSNPLIPAFQRNPTVFKLKNLLPRLRHETDTYSDEYTFRIAANYRF